MSSPPAGDRRSITPAPTLTSSGLTWEVEHVRSETVRVLTAAFLVMGVGLPAVSAVVLGSVERGAAAAAVALALPGLAWLLRRIRARIVVDANGISVTHVWLRWTERWTWAEIEEVEAGREVLIVRLRSGRIRRVPVIEAPPTALREVSQWIAARSAMRLPSTPEVPEELLRARSHAREIQ